jgi:hypothetical protein
MMDPNTYVLAAVLNGLRQRKKDKLPPEPEFTLFNLSLLRHAPKDNQRPEVALKPLRRYLRQASLPAQPATSRA